jgi:hypothetical protein
MDDPMAIDVVDAGHDTRLSSCFDVTRIWRRTERANLEKKPSIRLSHEPCLGVKVNLKRPTGRFASQAVVSFDMCGGMIVEDQLDCGACWVSGAEELKQFDKLTAAMPISNECMDLAAQQVDPGQQAKRAVAFVLVIPRKGGMDAGIGRQIRRPKHICRSDPMVVRLASTQ